MASVMSDTEEQRYHVRDGQRPLYFTGRMLAESDSQTGDQPRWTELTLYRTSGTDDRPGRYVIEKVGRSDVFHSDKCPEGKRGDQYASLDEAVEENERGRITELFVPCLTCRPGFDTSPVWAERDIFQATVYENAESAIESLYRRDKGNENVKFLSRVARVLLDTAAGADEDIARIVRAPVEIT